MRSSIRSLVEHAVSKVPEITLGFWIIKIAGTTLGEIRKFACRRARQIGAAFAARTSP